MTNLVYVDLVHTPEPKDRGPGAGRWQGWRVVVRSGDNGLILFKSTESYTNEGDAQHAAQLAFGNDANVYLRRSEQGNQLLRLADPETTMAKQLGDIDQLVDEAGAGVIPAEVLRAVLSDYQPTNRTVGEQALEDQTLEARGPRPKLPHER